MKVKHAFFCGQEKKKYKVGQEYTGSRTDLALYLEAEKPQPKAKTSEKKENKKGPKAKIEKK